MIKRHCDRAGCNNLVNVETPKIWEQAIGETLDERLKLDMCDECVDLWNYAMTDPKAMAMVFKGLKRRTGRLLNA